MNPAYTGPLSFFQIYFNIVLMIASKFLSLYFIFFLFFERHAIPLCIIKFVLNIMRRQYTTYIKQDAIITIR